MKQIKMIGIYAVIALFLLTSLSVAEPLAQIDSEPLVEEQGVTRTFIAGTVFRVNERNGTVSAKVLSMMYIEQNILIRSIGFVQAFEDVKFKPARLFYTYRPGPLGLVQYVIGFCSDFEILD